MSRELLLLAVPNISEGRDADLVRRIGSDPLLIDVHTDPDHGRSVLTYAGPPTPLVEATTRLVQRAVDTLDITTHEGAHPRFGVVDVLPFVPYTAGIDAAVESAWEASAAISSLGVPSHLYGVVGPELPALRRRLRTGHEAHPTAGVVCVGARGPLVAFNVNLDASMTEAAALARDVRAQAVRALALELPSRGLVQVSMNLTEPASIGPRETFGRVVRSGLHIVDAEIVGLVPDAVIDRLDGLPLRDQPRSVAQALGR